MFTLLSFLFSFFHLFVTKYVLVKDNAPASLEVVPGQNHTWKFQDRIIDHESDGYTLVCEELVCALKIRKTTKEMVGRYAYEGLTHHTQKFVLLHYKFECRLFSPKNYIIQNDCGGLSKTLASCKVVYTPGYDYKPQLKWSILFGKSVVEEGKFPPDQMEHLSHETAVENFSFPSINIRGVGLNCFVDEVDDRCFRRMFASEYLYLKNKSEASMALQRYNQRKPMLKEQRIEMKCQANVSPNISCFYEWVSPLNIMLSRTQVLQAHHINDKGYYECYAICRTDTERTCKLISDRFYYDPELSHKLLMYKTHETAFISILLVIFAVYCVLFICSQGRLHGWVSGGRPLMLDSVKVEKVGDVSGSKKVGGASGGKRVGGLSGGKADEAKVGKKMEEGNFSGETGGKAEAESAEVEKVVDGWNKENDGKNKWKFFKNRKKHGEIKKEDGGNDKKEMVTMEKDDGIKRKDGGNDVKDGGNREKVAQHKKKTGGNEKKDGGIEKKDGGNKVKEVESKSRDAGNKGKEGGVKEKEGGVKVKKSAGRGERD